MEKNRKMVAVAIAISLVVFAYFAYRLSLSQPPSSGARLSVYPEKIEDPTLLPSSIFSVNITVYNVTKMVTCTFNLSYASGIFLVDSVQKREVQGQSPSAYVDVDDLKGYVYVKLTYPQPITLPEKEATLVTVTFSVVDYGFTVLDLHDTLLKDSNGYEIPHEVQDGSVGIIKHDIAVVDVAVSTNETYVGRNVQINVTVRNEGNIAEESLTLKIYADSKLIGTLSVANLNATETREVAFNWNTTDILPSNTLYGIKAEVDSVPYETNVYNNVYLNGGVKIKIVGDINGDGVVDINDLTIWDSAFNSRSGEANWNEQADINGDGAVDKEDGLLIVQNYRNKL